MNRRNIIAGSRTVRLIRTPAALIYHAVLCCIFAVSLSIIHETQIPFTFFEIFWKNLKIGWFYVILYLLGRSSLSGREVIESMFAFVLNFALSIAASVIAYYICKWLDEQFFKPSKHWSISTETPSVLQYRGAFLLCSLEVNPRSQILNFASILYAMLGEMSTVSHKTFRHAKGFAPVCPAGAKPSPRGEGGTKCRMRWKPCGRSRSWSR